MKRRELTAEEREEAERLAQAWEKYRAENKGATQAWLAAEAGLGTQGAVSQYLRGAIPLNVEALAAMCRVMQVDPNAISPRLMSIVLMPPADPGPDGNYGLPPGTFMKVRVVDEDDPSMVRIPKVRLRLSAGINGFEVEPERYDGSTTMVPADWMMRNGYYKDNLISIVVKGESMEPTLYEGDLVVINTADKKMVDGYVYAFNYEGEPVVKRLERDGGQWWLKSDNQDQRKYGRKMCRGDACLIIGRVVRKESERL
jgi:SOS-response transcriptional repressor LexA